MPETRASRGGLGAFVRRSGYLRKWLILGISIGIIAGLGAVVFYLALDYAGRFLLGTLGGYDPPTAATRGSFGAFFATSGRAASQLISWVPSLTSQSGLSRWIWPPLAPKPSAVHVSTA